jgi:hypothetical protein
VLINDDYDSAVAAGLEHERSTDGAGAAEADAR